MPAGGARIESTAATVSLMRLAVTILTVLLAACAPKQDVVGSNERFEGDAISPTRALNRSDQSAVIQVMREGIGSHGYWPLEQASALLGWSDVPAAAYESARSTEMAVESQRLEGEVWFFSIRTLDDVPGLLRVERRPAPEYVLVTASIGRSDQRRRDADDLVAAFYDSLRAFGAKRRPQNRSEPDSVAGAATSPAPTPAAR